MMIIQRTFFCNFFHLPVGHPFSSLSDYFHLLAHSLTHLLIYSFAQSRLTPPLLMFCFYSVFKSFPSLAPSLFR